MLLKPHEIKAFQKKILSWYKKNKRDLPWRHTRGPYYILVSEIMLQQTQVERVIPKYEAWLKTFPTIESLAKAGTADILRMWSGLGYNRRALYLQKTAKTIATDIKGKWPEAIEELRKLPGIGEYTARAIACFAFDQQIAVVDTNIRRVIMTQFPMSHFKYQMSNKELLRIAEQILPNGRAYEWNQALMDFASAVLKKEKIPIPKQSRFKESRRYFRGKLLKLLLSHNELSLLDIEHFLRDSNPAHNTEWIDGLLKEMEQEGFIKRTDTKVFLA